jgi:trk system potassium uptake protein TrkA
MNVIVIGCGRVGSELAYRLYQKGHKVTVIEESAVLFGNLPPSFRGRTVEGDALDRGVLHRAGIEQADGVAVATNSDSMNAVVAHVVQVVYGKTNVVVRNYDPRYRSLLEDFGLQVISSSSWGAQRLEELLYDSQVHTVYSAGNGEVEIYEFSVPERWTGHTLQELLPEGGCVPVSLTRAGRAFLPDGESCLESGDILLVSATLEGMGELRGRLGADRES